MTTCTCSRPRTCCAVATQELADAAPADFAETLNAINAALTTEVLTQLGVEIVVDQTDMADVAHDVPGGQRAAVAPSFLLDR